MPPAFFLRAGAHRIRVSGGMDLHRKNKAPDSGHGPRRLTLLQWQMLLCALLVLGALACRLWLPTQYMALQAAYARWFDDADAEDALVRFASAVLDPLLLSASAASPAPDGSSLKNYVPDQSYVAPVSDFWLSSPYGWRVHPVTDKKSFHTGVDLACAEGTPIYAVMDGCVVYSLYSASGGNMVRLRHSDGVETVYCHMQYTFVRDGEQVTAGQLIGTAGSTGNATGPHLHFSLLVDDIYYDPSQMLGLS